MESHPIPQQISSYQFRLVGDMTLKQFSQIAAGAIIALIIYSLPIVGIIKWPIIFLVALGGIALAFLPIEDRPLERWVAAFFRAIYSPTVYNFSRSAQPKKFFQDEAPAPQEKVLYPGGEAKLQEYLKNPPVEKLADKLEKAESTYLSALASVLNPVSAPKPPVTPVAKTPLSIPVQKPPVAPVVLKTPPRPVLVETGAGVTPTASTVPISFRPSAKGAVAERQVFFSPEAAPPNPPTTPNTLAGQVLDENQKIIEGAILEIRDSIGQPVRALKSNKLGHFMVVTPLLSGQYEIITEKEGFEFEPVSFNAQGGIIPPIAISGKRTVPNNEKPN